MHKGGWWRGKKPEFNGKEKGKPGKGEARGRERCLRGREGVSRQVYWFESVVLFTKVAKSLSTQVVYSIASPPHKN
jgi:hypothetical protein